MLHAINNNLNNRKKRKKRSFIRKEREKNVISVFYYVFQSR